MKIKFILKVRNLVFYNYNIKKFLSAIFIIFVSAIISFAANIEDLKQKAEHEQAEAQRNLDDCYSEGDGVEKNPSEAPVHPFPDTCISNDNMSAG